MRRDSIALLTLLLAASSVCSAAGGSQASWAKAQAELARLGAGFLVWESPRSGEWRIWTRRLDCSGLRQLSPNERGRGHFGPHISPDGRHVVYLSFPGGVTGYGGKVRKGQRIPLHIMRADGSGDRVIVPDARCYSGDRSTVWLNDRLLEYIAADGQTWQLDIRTDRRVQLTTKGGHWLINRARTHATSGRPTFSVYDIRTRAIAPRKREGGCEPYFTHDGQWGFWMNGAGGPVRRFHLATRRTSIILDKDDKRLPRDRDYIYFPMVSRCGRLFTFACSPDQHDHFKSDYDVFVARMDPRTLEVLGRPIRYTFHGACDRYPDVFLQPLALGRHEGEAPFTVSLTLDGAWQWDYGDGRRGRTGRHTYDRAGSYAVTASRDGAVRMGQVRVTPPSPPRVLDALLRGGREIVVRFDEPIQLREPALALASGAAIQSWKADGSTLIVQLATKLRATDELRLDGIYDRAPRPNRMEAQTIAVRPLTWPTNRAGLVFLWQTGNSPNLVLDPRTNTRRTYEGRPRGRAMLDRHYAIELAGGSFPIEGADAALLAACRKSGELTLEATLRPDDLTQSGPARIVTLSSNASSRNFTFGQQADQLVLRLRTPKTGDNGTNPETPLCRLAAGEATHVIVSYRPGRLLCWANGRKVLDTAKVQGDLSNWSPHRLLFGDEADGQRDWAGTLEGVALYSRALDEREAMANWQGTRALLAARKPVPRLELEAKLLAVSRFPTLANLGLYGEALVVYEYGILGDKRLRVAHWAYLDRKPMPIRQRKVGTACRLTLEPFNAHPQLERRFVADTLEEDFDIRLYYDVGK